MSAPPVKEIKSQAHNGLGTWTAIEETRPSGDVFAVKQLLDTVQETEQTNTVEFLARVGIVAANALILADELYISGVPLNSTDVINRCYSLAIRSQQMRNIMACFIADYELTSVMSQTFKSPQIADTTTERFIKSFSEIGFNEEAKRFVYSQYREDYSVASQWRSSRTISQIQDCISSGVGTLACP